MLKVLKYDWKNGWNAVKPVLPAALILSVLFGLFMGRIGGTPVASQTAFGVVSDKEIDIVVMVLSVVWFGVMTALLVLTVIAIDQNMDRRMFGTEGYLTHTLPVETWELLGGKTIGTWLFGLFMFAVALVSIPVIMLFTAVGTGEMVVFFRKLIDLLPKLGAYHFQQLAAGAGYAIWGIAAFCAWSFLVIVQLQFVCIAGRLFGKYYLAGEIIVLWVLISLENNLNRLLSAGFLVCLLVSAACFCGSCWLVKKKLNV